MKYALLGNTGAFVSRLCLGAMTFGGADTAAGRAIGRLTSHEADALVGQAMAAGINFIDTADVYGAGGSETVLGSILPQRRDEVFLATKFSARTGPGVNNAGQSRPHMMRALEAILRRLKTDHIDLYQLHNFDPVTPMDQVLRSLDDAVRQGKVRFIGCSNLAAWQLMKSLGISERAGLERFVSIQSFYSLCGRDVEDEVIPVAEDQGVGVLCWSPLAGGLLSGKFSPEGNVDPSARRAQIAFPPVDEEKAFVILQRVRSIAEEIGASPAQVALAWLLGKPAVTSVIIGVKNASQLSDNLGAIGVTLSDEQMNSLNEVSASSARYPRWIQTYNASSRVPAGYAFSSPSWALGESPL